MPLDVIANLEVSLLFPCVEHGRVHLLWIVGIMGAATLMHHHTMSVFFSSYIAG